MVLFCSLTSGLESSTKMLFLIGLLETQITGQHKSLQINYVFSTTTDIGHARWWLRMSGTYPQCHITHWPRAHMRSRDQWKPKYLLFCMSYGPKTWPGSGIWWGLLAHNVIWISEHVVTWGHVTNQKLNISSSKRYMITKLFGVVTYDEGNSPIMSSDSHNEVTWSHVTNWKRDIFSCATPVTTKLGRFVTCNAENSRIMSNDPLTT